MTTVVGGPRPGAHRAALTAPPQRDWGENSICSLTSSRSSVSAFAGLFLTLFTSLLTAWHRFALSQTRFHRGTTGRPARPGPACSGAAPGRGGQRRAAGGPAGGSPGLSSQRPPRGPPAPTPPAIHTHKITPFYLFSMQI